MSNALWFFAGALVCGLLIGAAARLSRARRHPQVGPDKREAECRRQFTDHEYPMSSWRPRARSYARLAGWIVLICLAIAFLLTAPM